MMKIVQYISILLALTIWTSCSESAQKGDTPISQTEKALQKYVPFKLTTDVSQLTENEKKMLPILIEASQVMNELFWFDSYGDKTELL